jgi:co-chaperonin GroES (HSP10)
LATQRVLDVKVRIVAIGPLAWASEGTPRAKVGDIVYVAKMSGFMVHEARNGKAYRFVNDRDIFARVTEADHE